jgi:uncharacterized protein (DUF302 family)
LRVTRSRFDHAETVRRLVEAIERSGMKMFARIDHAAAARDAGLELADEQVMLFGNPRAGTPLMQTDPRVGIELPLRIVVWDGRDGVSIGYNDPRDLAGRYALEPHTATLETMATLLDDLVAEASG